MQRHEPSRKTLAAFACVTPASLLTLQPPDNFAIDAMDHACGVCVGGLGVAVAAMVSQSANGLGSGSGIVDSTSRLPVAGASALARIADSSRTSREVGKVPTADVARSIEPTPVGSSLN